MIAWFKRNMADHGFWEATKLLTKSYGFRIETILSNAALPARVECPCCGWTGRKFFGFFEYGVSVYEVECPGCLSHGRHRALHIWLTKFLKRHRPSGTALVFAPERALEPIWEGACFDRVVRTDIECARGVDVIADIRQIPLANGSVDLVWCHHILEQVRDDIAAISEIFRVLMPSSGHLVVSSSMTSAADTREYPAPNAMELGNWRVYGQDFPERLRQAGFVVEQIDYDLEEADEKRFGINSGEKAYLCTRLS